MASGRITPEVDLLHPLATLHWEYCHTWKDDIWSTHCAVLEDKVAILTVSFQFCDELNVFSTDLLLWTTITLPYQWMSLTTYQSKFIAVGGRHPSTHECTDKLFTIDTGLMKKVPLPPMPTKRASTSSVSTRSPEALVVAGGMSGDSNLDVVEVLIGNHWYTVAPLPKALLWMRSVLHDENLYFLGGQGQDDNVYTCSCSSLISSCKKSDTSLWSQIKAPSDRNVAVSYSSYLVSIDCYCTIKAYFSKTQSWVETTSTGDRSDRYSGDGAAAVLPTGELVCSTRCSGVYRVKLSVGSFSLDSRFMSNVLSRLEAVMGVKTISVLTNSYSQLATTSGVQLQPPVDEWEKLCPDQRKAFGHYVISQWSAGHSHRPPTWRHLLDVIRDIGQPDLSQKIGTFMKDETRYLEAHRYFINNKESLALLFLKFLFLGPPQLGKSTTLRRLMGKITDLQSAGEEDQNYPSTGAVESGAVLVRSVSNTTAVITQSEWSAVESVEDEAHMLLHNLIHTLTSPSNDAATSSSAEVQTHSLSTASVAETTSSQPTSQSAAETERIVQQLTPAPPAAQATRQPQVSASTQDIPEMIAMFQKAMGSSYWKDVKKMFKAYLRVEDTGGQPELMDMLPALTIGPGLYLLFINLQNDLDHHYKLTYCDKSGTNTLPEESTYNVKEMLFSSLSSIWCSSSSSSRSVLAKDEGILPGINNILKTSKSKAYIVGTHKDKVTEDRIKEMNEQLQKIVESTEFSDLVEYFSPDELIVAIDNMAGGVEEVKKVQALLERCMSRCFTELRVPVVWLLLSLLLRRKKKRTVSLKDCMHLSEALNMSSHETEVALWFLHHHAGVLMYFPNIPELKDLVIIDIQIMYDSVTFLIQKAMSWEEVGVHKARKFRKTGKFTIGQLTAITSRACGDFIPIDKLVVLLEYLHIIALISPYQETSLSYEEETYIMPCVLDSANKEELDTISNKPHEVCPIMVRFKCGFVPIGIFPAMIACLISSKSFTVIEEGIKKNVVQFHYGVHRTLITFLCRPMYYSFTISSIFLPELKLHNECFTLRKEIEASFDRVCSRMNYGALMEYEFAFTCPIHTECGHDHLCVVNREESSPVMMDCLLNMEDRTPVPLNDQHKLWYGKAVSTEEASRQAETSRTSPSHGFSPKHFLSWLFYFFVFSASVFVIVLLLFTFGNIFTFTNIHSPTLTLDGKPTMSQFRHFTCARGPVDIVQEVADQCKKLGYLLQLPEAMVTNVMSVNSNGGIEDKCETIILKWLRGHGSTPVTWRAFIDVLKKMKDLLADELLEELSKSSRDKLKDL